jgi:GNAT superfamily N-acetyltransferase
MTIAPAAVEPAEAPRKAPPCPGRTWPPNTSSCCAWPLPTDRNTGARPLRFVQFGYAERHDKAHSLLRMEIRLPGQKVRKEQNRLDMCVDHAERLVRIGSDSGLQLEPLNRGIGRFLLAQAAQWLQRNGRTTASTAWPAEQGCAERRHPPAPRPLLRGVGFEVEYADAST